MKYTSVISLLCMGFFFALSGQVAMGAQDSFKMDEVIRFLQGRSVVDLTHAFSPSIPVPDGLPKPERKAIYGGAVQIFTHVGQYGTHLDAPGHFHPGMRLVEAIPPNEFIREGCVIDISQQARANFDYQLQLADVKQWEKKYGPIPEGAFVMLRSDWSFRWSDPAAFFAKDKDGQKHYPGWGMEALKYLIEERKIGAIGHETPDTDSGLTCGVEKGWPIESYVLKQDIWQIENMNNLYRLPAKGFMVIVGVPKGDGATGFPTRVFAILP